VGKGRDMGFIAVSGFESKISAGAAVTAVSRDMQRMVHSFDMFRMLSFYFSMAGFYITTLQSMWSVYLFSIANLVMAVLRLETFEVFQFAEVALNASSIVETGCEGARRALEGEFALAEELQAPDHSSVECSTPLTEESAFFLFSWSSILGLSAENSLVSSGPSAADGLYEGSANSGEVIEGRFTSNVYNSAFVFHLGMLGLLPLILEFSIQFNFIFALKEIVRMLASFSFVFYPFSMQTKAHNFGFAVNYGRAGYVATGRGYAIEPAYLVTLYTNYAASHIYFGAEVGLLLVLYEVWKDASKSFLSTWGTWMVVASLTLSPWFYNPRALHSSTIGPSWVEWTSWMYPPESRGSGRAARRLKPDGPTSSWRAWATGRLAHKRRAPANVKALLLLRNLSSKVILLVAFGGGLQLAPSADTIHTKSLLLLFSSAGMMLLSVAAAVVVTSFEALMLRGCLRHSSAHRWLPIYVAVLLCSTFAGAIFGIYVYIHRPSDVAWLAILSRIREDRNIWMLFFGAVSALAGVVQLATAIDLSKSAKHSSTLGLLVFPRFLRLALRWWADFWSRMVDLLLGLGLFLSLVILSILPISVLQTKMLFNQAFTQLVERKIHRQSVLEDLFTPGFFKKPDAAPRDSLKKPGGLKQGWSAALVGCSVGGGRSRRKSPSRPEVDASVLAVVVPGEQLEQPGARGLRAVEGPADLLSA